jgi:hypothetical protein
VILIGFSGYSLTAGRAVEFESHSLARDYHYTSQDQVKARRASQRANTEETPSKTTGHILAAPLNDLVLRVRRIGPNGSWFELRRGGA